MPKVALAAGTGTDPIGERALLSAFSTCLPEYEVVPVAAPWAKPAAAYREIGGAAALVLTGETTLALPSSVRAAAAFAPLASVTHTRLTLMGVGAGSLDRAADRWLSRQLVRQADLLLLADEESSRVLAGAGAATPLRVAADPAWASLRPPTADHGDTGETVVAVIDGARSGEERERLIETLALLAADGRRVRIQPWASSGHAGLLDHTAAERVAIELGGRAELSPPPRDLNDATELIGDAAVVVTERYRAIQAAAEAGIPVVPVADDLQMIALARRLGQAVVDPHMDAPSIAVIVRAAVLGPGPSPAAVKEEISRAEAGFDLLRLVMEQGAADLSTLERLPLSPEPWL